MTATLDAIYEAGHLRLLQQLPLPEHTRLRVRVETPVNDIDREGWLAAGEQSLMKAWDNDADDMLSMTPFSDNLSGNERRHGSP